MIKNQMVQSKTRLLATFAYGKYMSISTGAQIFSLFTLIPFDWE